LAQSSEARVFRGSNGAFYGCLFSTGRNTFLATKSIRIRNVHTAGPFAAFSRAGFRDGESGEDIPTVVESVGLCRGGRGDRRMLKWIASTGDRPSGEDSVTDLDVSRHGDIAWIATDGAGYQVFKLDATSAKSREPRLLGEGEEVDPRSLRIKGSRVTWSQGGEPTSAPLRKRVATCRG
jgi:hypothetical protein